MRIMTLENQSFLLNSLPEVIEDDLRFAVLDNSNPQDPDFFFNPLIFLESFNSPAIVMEIGGNEITMPLDWSIVICDPECGNPEVLSLMSLNDRGFSVFAFNPLTGFTPKYLDVNITNIYTDVKWYAPKLKFGHLLNVPLSDEPNSPCVLFVKEANKLPEVLDISELW